MEKLQHLFEGIDSNELEEVKGFMERIKADREQMKKQNGSEVSTKLTDSSHLEKKTSTSGSGSSMKAKELQTGGENTEPKKQTPRRRKTVKEDCAGVPGEESKEKPSGRRFRDSKVGEASGKSNFEEKEEQSGKKAPPSRIGKQKQVPSADNRKRKMRDGGGLENTLDGNGDLVKIDAGNHTSRSTAQKQVFVVPPLHGLSAFGFSRNTVTNRTEDKRKLFSTFVQDKRIAPQRIRYWEPLNRDAEEKQGAEDQSAESVQKKGKAHTAQGQDKTTPGSEAFPTAFDPFFAFRDEDSSLMHPPLCPPTLVEPEKKKNFAEMIEASNQNEKTRGAASSGRQEGNPLQICRLCPCSFHSSASPAIAPIEYENHPTDTFDNEVLFIGFYAIAYEPYLARPSFFGTYNQFLNENLTESEVLKLARFPAGEEPPRFSTLDYEYDSGDDWDMLEGDEEIGSSISDSLQEGDDDLSSSDFDFINDDDDASDSDNELQRNIIEARRRRLNRLRGKDKLIPSFSGPFIGMLPREHPLQKFDRFDAFLPLHEEGYFERMLEEELQLFGGVGSATVRRPETTLNEAEMEVALQRKMQEAALKNRRKMSGEELEALHLAVRLNNKSSTKLLFEVLRGQQLCVGVAQSEFSRTIKRFYDRKHNMLVLRKVPWEETDERLFSPSKSTAKSLTIRNSMEEDQEGRDSGDLRVVATVADQAAGRLTNVEEELENSSLPQRKDAEESKKDRENDLHTNVKEEQYNRGVLNPVSDANRMNEEVGEGQTFKRRRSPTSEPSSEVINVSK